MRKFKKMNYGLLIGAVLIIMVLMYLIIATAVNHADEAKIRDVVYGFTDSFAAVNKENRNNGAVDIGVFHDALKQFYKGDVDSSAALELCAGGYDFDAVSRNYSNISVNYSSFSKASVSAELRSTEDRLLVTLNFETAKVSGSWKIVSWDIGNAYNYGY
ncbi:MAG: hypothetical protein K6B54_02540 [Clostridia bacterium]|nr:hypothetical protein [Clostridia bacterium]